MATITDVLWQELIARGVVRDPRVAGGLPPAWRQPVDGVPAPGEGSDPIAVGATAVVGLIRALGPATPRFEVDWRRDIVDIWLRTTKWPATEQLYAAIRPLLVDRRNWLMGTSTPMRIIESLEDNNLALVDSDLAQGFTSRFSILFETYAADHF